MAQKMPALENLPMDTRTLSLKRMSLILKSWNSSGGLKRKSFLNKKMATLLQRQNKIFH